jgi:hypothetical protein
MPYSEIKFTLGATECLAVSQAINDYLTKGQSALARDNILNIAGESVGSYTIIRKDLIQHYSVRPLG